MEVDFARIDLFGVDLVDDTRFKIRETTPKARQTQRKQLGTEWFLDRALSRGLEIGWDSSLQQLVRNLLVPSGA